MNINISLKINYFHARLKLTLTTDFLEKIQNFNKYVNLQKKKHLETLRKNMVTVNCAFFLFFDFCRNEINVNCAVKALSNKRTFN